MTSVDWNGLPLRDPYAGPEVPRWIVGAVCWVPFLVNLMPVVFYAAEVVQWLALYSPHRTALCYAVACESSERSLNEVPWPLAIGMIFAYMLVVTGPVSLFILGGFTTAGAGMALRAGRTVCRVATLVAGVLVLAVGVFQTTPVGAMFANWLVD